MIIGGSISATPHQCKYIDTRLVYPWSTGGDELVNVKWKTDGLAQQFTQIKVIDDTGLLPFISQ